MPNLIKEAPNLVQKAIDAGMIKVSVGPPINPRKEYKSEWDRKRRMKLYAKGLNYRGEPRKYTSRPELQGLKAKTPEYLKAYRALLKKGT